MPTLTLNFASGESSLSVRRFAVQEGISTLFTITIWAVSDDPSLDLDTIVGLPAWFYVTSDVSYAPLGGERHFGGICEHMALVRAEPAGKSTYVLRIVPTMWLLTQRHNHRIFQRLSIPDIVDKILARWGIAPSWKIVRARYPKLEFKVQYGESDFDFVYRLLNEAGIAFTFPEDSKDVSKLTFDDELHACKPRATAPIRVTDSHFGVAREELLSRVHLGHDVRPGAHVIRDHDFRKPAFAWLGNAADAPALEDRYQQFEYLPGAFRVASKGGDTPAADDKGAYRHDQEYGDTRAQRSLEGERIQKRAVVFETNTVDLWPGVVFSTEGHPHSELSDGQTLLCTGFFLEGAADQEWHMSGTAVFAAAPYRPPATVPKPRIHSVQSATVVGPAGQQIHTDEFGRVRVQFPWDREGQNNDNSSIWMRVRQEWAGTGFGMITIPRIGQEVLVGFLDGDPDQPIVVGRLFNVLNPEPHKLPDNKTRSEFHSNSSPGSQGFNEIMLEDLAGDELVYQQAEKNLRRLVKHDEVITVGHDREKGVAVDETDTTVGNRVEETDGDRLEEIVGSRTTAAEQLFATAVGGDEIERTLGSQIVLVGKDEHVIVKKTKRELDEKDLHLQVKGSQSESFGAYSLATSAQQEKVAGNDALETGLTLHEKAGTALVAEGLSSVTIKGPGGFIHIGPGGIDIVGTLVMINEGGSPGSAPDAKPAGPEKPKQGVVVAPPLEIPPPPPQKAPPAPEPLPPTVVLIDYPLPPPPPPLPGRPPPPLPPEKRAPCPKCPDMEIAVGLDKRVDWDNGADNDAYVLLKCEHPAHRRTTTCNIRIRVPCTGTFTLVVLVNPDGRLRFRTRDDESFLTFAPTMTFLVPADGS